MAWLFAGPQASVPVAAPVLTLARPVDQARFTATTFATGLSFPTSMAELADGSLLVAESAGATLFGSTSGRLVRLVDADGDGVADGPPEVLASGADLPGLVTSVRRVGDLVVALSSQAGNEAITFWRTGPTPGSPLAYAGRVGLTFPAGFEHTAYALAARVAPDDPAAVEVYFNVGAAANSVATPSSSTVALTGSGVAFAPAVVLADSVHRLRVNDAGGSLSVSAPQQIARGLRNAAGMTFDAAGNLYLQDNGIDTEGNRGVSFSADELNRIPAATLGQTMLDFGFAESYVRSADGVLVNSQPGFTDPLAAFLPVDGRRSEGAVEIAMAPAGFGAEFAGGVFTAFFGQWGRAGPANEENPIVFADPATGEHFHFVANQVHGHPYGMFSNANSLFMADLAWTGRLDAAVDGVAANEAGVIYRITPVPEPGGWAASASAVVALASLRAWRRRATTARPTSRKSAAAGVCLSSRIQPPNGPSACFASAAQLPADPAWGLSPTVDCSPSSPGDCPLSSQGTVPCPLFRKSSAIDPVGFEFCEPGRRDAKPEARRVQGGRIYRDEARVISIKCVRGYKSASRHFLERSHDVLPRYVSMTCAAHFVENRGQALVVVGDRVEAVKIEN